MRPPLLAAKAMNVPPGWVLRTYLSLGPAADVELKALERQAKSPSMARQFVHVATKHHLLVRLRAGRYAAIDPSVAIRTWAVPAYWAELLALHSVLARIGVDHAFACLAAGKASEYVPERPWVVTRRTAPEGLEKMDRFLFDYSRPAKESAEIMGQRFSLPLTNSGETALLLAATGLPRERIAAKQILDRHPPTKALAKKLNYYGLVALPSVVESVDPGIQLPSFLSERRDRFGQERLREGLG